MKLLSFIFFLALFVSCTPASPSYKEEKLEGRVTALQTQIRQLQSRFDSLLQVIPPKASVAAKKAKVPIKRMGREHASLKRLASYNWETTNIVATPVVRIKKEESLYKVRIGAICRDGTRSYVTGRGAYSHHGGVS